MPADIQHNEESRNLSHPLPYVYTIGWRPTFNGSACIATSYASNWAINSGDLPRKSFDLLEHDDFKFNSNKQFISLKNEYRQHALKNEMLNNPDVEAKVSSFVEALLRLQADKITSQVSFDNSLLYNLLKDDYKIYIHFFLEQEEDEDEVVFSITKQGDNLLSFGGSSEESLIELFSFFNLQYKSELKAIFLHELSY